ncbi:MAG: hypothetical protein H8D23_15235 [Candidatus Brocadiales bacterium]|nr:hypothetical protein [Candidatus Brocadiales bacterium]
MSDLGLHIYEPKDYIHARIKILEHISQNSDLEIFIFDRVIDTWFWDLENETYVNFVNDNPTDSLKTKLNKNHIPEFITPKIIAELELLNEPSPLDSSVDPLTWILTTKLGDVWGESKPSYDHVATLVTWGIDHEFWKQKALYESLIEEKLSIWMKDSTGNLHLLYKYLKRDLKHTLYFLYVWNVLTVYEEDFKERLLKDKGWFISELVDINVDISVANISPKIDESLKNNLYIYWNRILLEKFEDLNNES